MKIPYPITCGSCNTVTTVEIDSDSRTLDWDCSSCTEHHSVMLDIPIEIRILQEARHQFVDRKDYTKSIIFSAMAFESCVSRLFIKWRRIEWLENAAEKSRSHHLEPTAQVEYEELDEQLSDEMRKLGNIDKKIAGTATLMHVGGLDDFVQKHASLRNEVTGGFPSLHIGSLAQDFQKALFWLRNKILHYGFGSFTEADAKRCFNIASIGIKIFVALDQKRRAVGRDADIPPLTPT